MSGSLTEYRRKRDFNKTAELSGGQLAASDQPIFVVQRHTASTLHLDLRLGVLPTIAPKRFNPEGKAWLPLLTTKRGGWSFTAMFSNTARAHEAGKTDDWVVIYFERAGGEE